MAVALAGTGAGWSTTAGVTSGTTVTLAKPGNLADGHVLVATVTHQNASPNVITSAPAGWTQVGSVNTAQSRCTATYLRTVSSAATEAASWSWTYSQTGRCAGVLLILSGAAGTADTPGYSATTATLTAPSVTPSAADGLLLYVGVSNVAGGGQTFTPPGGMTQAGYASAAPSSSTNLTVCTEQRALAAATGTRAAAIATGPAFSGGGAYQLVLLATPAPTKTAPAALSIAAGAPVVAKHAAVGVPAALGVVTSVSAGLGPTRITPAALALTATSSDLITDRDPPPMPAALAVTAGAPTIRRGAAIITPTTTNTGASGTAITVSKPDGVTDQTTLVAVMYARNVAAAITPPAGWALAEFSNTNGSLAIFTKYIPRATVEAPTSYTFGSAGGRWAIACFGAVGVDSVSPVADTDASTANTGAGWVTVPSLTVDTPESLLVMAFQANHGSVVPTIDPPAGMSELAELLTPGGITVLDVAAGQATVGETGDRMATLASTANPPASNASTLGVVLRAGGYVAAAPVLLGAVVGAVRDDGFQVVAHTGNATTARLGVRPASTTNAWAFGAPSTPGDRGYIRLTAPPGLGPSSDYEWAIELDGTAPSAPTATLSTLPPRGPASFSFAAASCARTNSNHEVFDAIRTREGPDGPAVFFMHLGDMHYADLNDHGLATLDNNFQQYENVLAQPRQAQLYRETPLVVTPSDHDWGGSNSDKNNPNGPYYQQVYRTIFPHYDLVADFTGDGGGVYHSFGVGRVLFIVTDQRSYQSVPMDPDGPDKTKLGAAQKAWLKNELLREDYPMKVIFGDSGWNNRTTYVGETNNVSDDTWSGYNTERVELGEFIQGNSIPVWYVHGDFHALAADDGSTNLWGGFPVACCSPLDQTTYEGNGLWSQGFHPNPVGLDYAQQYGWFDVSDDGDQITLTYTGYTADGSPRITLSRTYVTVRKFSGWGTPV